MGKNEGKEKDKQNKPVKKTKKIYDQVKNYILKKPVKKEPSIKNRKMNVELYFVRHIERNDRLALVKVERSIPLADTPLTDTIILLLEGPTPSEEKRKITSVFWGNTKLRSARIIKSTAYLDFNAEIEIGVGISMLQARLYQVVYTATQFPEVESVRILINGKAKHTFSTEGLSIKNPLKRLDRKPIF